MYEGNPIFLHFELICQAAKRCYDAAVMRTTITLPDDLARDVKREAQRRRVSISNIAREALREHIDAAAAKPVAFIGIGGSGRRDTARRAEEILAREWGDARRP